jgi:hypothetical protein
MAYPGDFVAANCAARTDAQRAAIRRVSDLSRACFRVREWLAKRIPLGIYCCAERLLRRFAARPKAFDQSQCAAPQ